MSSHSFNSAETASLQEGTLIQGLRVVGLLGRGGMGEVYKAFDPQLNRFVAIKIVGEAAASDPQFAARFEREARAASSIQHPNIAQIFSAGVHEGRPFYVMEFIEGHSLAEVLEGQGSLSGFKCLSYLMQVADGLRAARRAGIVHRDIKPANLMLDPEGRLKIVDFGLARWLTGDSTLTQSNMILGTPAYMAPEQAMGRQIDHRSDIYSLGATFYHLFSGQQPFVAETPVGLMMKHVSEPLPPLKDRNPRVPQGVCAVIERMLAKDPTSRYPDYNELIADLDRLKTGSGGFGSSGVTSRAARQPHGPLPTGGLRQLPVPWAILAMLVVVVAVVFWPRRDGSVAGEPEATSSPVHQEAESPPGDRPTISLPPITVPPTIPITQEPPLDEPLTWQQPPYEPQPGEAFPYEEPLPQEARGEPPTFAREQPSDRAVPKVGETLPTVPTAPPPSQPAIPPPTDVEKLIAESPMMAMARRAQTQARLRQLYTALMVYHAENEELPRDLRSLRKRLGVPPGALRDTWGRPIHYQHLGRDKARLTSEGPDRVLGTADDIVLQDGLLVERGF